jgi:hypothetical protein
MSTTPSEQQEKSVLAAFFAWLLGLSLAWTFFHYINISEQQTEALRKIVNISCFGLLTIGALLREQKYKAVKLLGSGIISLALVFLGTAAFLIIQTYKDGQKQ